MNNRERKEHAKSMKEFDRDYRKTKEGVWKQTRQYQTGSRKKVVIGLAGFFLIVFCIFMAELQAGALEKSLRRWKAGNNYDTVISQIQEYLDQGEYGKLFEYGEYYHLTDSEKGKFADYYNVFWCAWRYDRTAGDIDSYLRSQDYEDPDIRDSYLQSLADSLSSFYQESWPDQYPEEMRSIYETMRTRMGELLEERIGLSEATVEEASSGKGTGRMKKLLSLVIVILTVLMSIELIAIADNAIGFLPDGTRTVTFLTYISREEYAYCVERYYKNEALGVEPDEEMLECYGVARYYEAALQRQVSLRKGDREQAKAAEEQMEQAYGQMGELALVRDRIDEVIER